MIKNQIVNVYQKPITGEDYEGRARLIEEIRPDQGDGLSIWSVEFQNQPGTFYPRTINALTNIDRAYLLYSEALTLYLKVVGMSWSTNEPRFRRAREAAWHRFSRRYNAFIEG